MAQKLKQPIGSEGTAAASHRQAWEALAPVYKALENALKRSKTLEQQHNYNAQPMETRYYAANEEAESVRDLATIQWRDKDERTSLVAAKSFSKEVEKVVKTAVKACIV